MDYMEYIREFIDHALRPETGIAIVVALLVYGALNTLRSIVRRIVRKQAERRDSVWLYVIQETLMCLRSWFFGIVALYAGIFMLAVSSTLLDSALVFALAIQTAIVISAALDDLLMIQFGKEGDETRRSALNIISRIGAGIVWALAFLFALSNVGVDTTSLVAGLGVGGIAIAFALQGILSDLFSAFTVFFDKPFEVGDFVAHQGQFGTVKRIGIMTTRLELLSGEELVVTNQDLTTNMLENHTRLEERRVSFSLGTVYELSAETVAEIPTIIREVIESQEHARFGRAHFKGFGDYALLFEAVYFVELAEYDRYMDIQQDINLEIMRQFEQRGIALAYPTQTLHVKQNT